MYIRDALEGLPVHIYTVDREHELSVVVGREGMDETSEDATDILAGWYSGTIFKGILLFSGENESNDLGDHVGELDVTNPTTAKRLRDHVKREL